MTVLFGLLPGPAVDWADDATLETVATSEWKAPGAAGHDRLG